jgi:hypothetical protein
MWGGIRRGLLEQGSARCTSSPILGLWLTPFVDY